MRRASIIAFSVLLATLGGCNRPGPDKPGQDASAQASDQADDGQGEGEGGASSAAGQSASGEPAPEPKKSIIRPEVDAGPTQAPVLLPVHLVVPWPARAVRLDDAGRALIDGLLGDPTFQAGGPVTIWGHSDSHGTDSANLASSRQRALAARAYLIAKGVNPARITVVAMGEASPLVPNRRRDGTDDPDARAKNRRVEIEAVAPLPAPPPAAPNGKQAGPA